MVSPSINQPHKCGTSTQHQQPHTINREAKKNINIPKESAKRTHPRFQTLQTNSPLPRPHSSSAVSQTQKWRGAAQPLCIPREKWARCRCSAPQSWCGTCSVVLQSPSAVRRRRCVRGRADGGCEARVGVWGAIQRGTRQWRGSRGLLCWRGRRR